MATALPQVDENGDKTLYEQFHNYGFLQDEQFLAGWNKIKEKSSAEGISEQQRFLQAKLFYFSRFFAPVDKDTYISWLKEQTIETGEDTKEEAGCAGEPEEVCEQDGSSDKKNTDSIVAEPDTTKRSTEDAKKTLLTDPVDQTADSEIPVTCEPKYPVSFHEVMQLVEKGEAIPGVEELHITPTNEQPTESNIPLKKKPWES